MTAMTWRFSIKMWLVGGGGGPLWPDVGVTRSSGLLCKVVNFTRTGQFFVPGRIDKLTPSPCPTYQNWPKLNTGRVQYLYPGHEFEELDGSGWTGSLSRWQPYSYVQSHGRGRRCHQKQGFSGPWSSLAPKRPKLLPIYFMSRPQNRRGGRRVLGNLRISFWGRIKSSKL